jgi:hypothetical protein
MLCYLRFHEALPLTQSQTSATAPDGIPGIVKSMGFVSLSVPTLISKAKALRNKITQAVRALNIQGPRQPLPPSGFRVSTIKVPGPLNREYTIIDEPLPQRLITAAVARRPKNKIPLPKLCIQAAMELFFDIKLRKRLSFNTWYRTRPVDSSVKPWHYHEKITDVNPQVLDEDHYFWDKRFEADTMAKPIDLMSTSA